jgi:putative sterol carrier protein
VPVFPSEQWVDAWVALANRTPEFEASGRGWEGAMGLVIEPDADAGLSEPIYVRLDGRHGKWLGSELGKDSSLVEGAVFVLRAPYPRWKDLIAQTIQPIRALLQGKVRVEGHLPVVLRWTTSLVILAELAGRIDTEFVDELASDSGSRAAGDGT